MREKKKVLVITYYWPPSGGAGVQRWLKFVKYLPEFGFTPVVLTVDENYANYPLLDKSLRQEISSDTCVIKTKSKEPFGIYKKLTGKKTLPHSGFSNENKPGFKDKIFRFIRGNFFIPDPRKGWNRFAYHSAVALIKEHNIDCIITTSPPHSTHLIGLKLKRNLGVKWVADLRDPWTDIFYYKDLKHTRWAEKKDLAYERQVFEQADSIVTVSDGLKDIFAAKSNLINTSKIHIIPNGYDESDFENMQLVKEKSFDWSVGYMGSLPDNYPIEPFVKAFARLIRKWPEVNIQFTFVGNLPAYMLNLIREEKIEKNLNYLGYLQHKEALAQMSQVDSLYLVIPDVANNKGLLSGKLFEYIALKKPVIFVGPKEGDAARIIKFAEAGAIFGYDSEDELFEYMDQLINDWKAGITNHSDRNNASRFSRRSLTESLAQILKD